MSNFTILFLEVGFNADFLIKSLEIKSHFYIQKVVSFFQKVNKFIILYCLFAGLGRKMLTLVYILSFFILIFKET